MLIHRIFDEYAFALIEPMTCEDFPESVDALPLLPTGLEDCAHLLPALIDLRAQRRDQRDALLEWIERSAQPPLGALLATRADRGRTMRHLARQLIVRLTDGRRSLLRFHDGRVFAHLRWILDAHRLQHLLGPLQRWTYWRDGRWRHVDRAEAKAAEPRPRRLDETQSDHLARVGAINDYFAEHGAPGQDNEFTNQARALSGYIARAQGYGWPQRADWLAFAQLCIGCHPEFDRHPRISQLIERLPADEATFRDAIALIDVDTRRRIVDELMNASQIPRHLTTSLP